MTDRLPTFRVAPSPTGYLHVGVARTALFNWLYAKHVGGRFVVRIEDTDLERSKEELIEPILSALSWLGLDWDGEIVRQSTRLEHYKTYAQQILKNGHGYRCFCSREQLAADREKARIEKTAFGYNRRCLGLSEAEIQEKIDSGEEFALRLRIPEGETTYTDMVAGELRRDNKEIEDFIIARSDGTATYNLAVVIDDHDMEISHVIRGNDHITNTFKQIHIYNALGFDIPQFGHTPMILRTDKKKVSKRLGDKDVNQFNEEGILPEAMVNYLSLLGWSPKTDNEIYSVQELIDRFTPDNFNNSNAVFDQEKLLAFNKEHIQLKSDHDLATMVAPLLVDAGLTTKYWLETRWEYLRDVVGCLKERMKRVSDIVELSGYFFSDEFSYDEKAKSKHFHAESKVILTELVKRIEALPELTSENAEEVISGLSEDQGIKKALVIHPTRLAVSGVPGGPGLYDILNLLGRKIVLDRLHRAIDFITNEISG